MKQQRFTQIWGILTILQIILYVVCFSHLVKTGDNPVTPWPVVNSIVIDFLGISAWYLFHLAYETKATTKVVGILLFLCSLVATGGILFLNIHSLFMA
jgi:hypothetical protein